MKVALKLGDGWRLETFKILDRKSLETVGVKGKFCESSERREEICRDSFKCLREYTCIVNRIFLEMWALQVRSLTN